MRIHLLALDGVFDTGLSALLDTFATAQELAVMQGLSSLRFTTTVVGVRRKVRTAQGLAVPVEVGASGPAPHYMLQPALGCKQPGPLLQALERPDVRDGVAALRAAAAGKTKVGAACIGTFLLAETGLLDNHEATTTWWLAPLFRQRYPRVRLDPARMLVRSGTLVTTGAALSHIDLALWVIRQESPSLADLTARYLIIDPRPSQSAYALSDHLAHSDPLVERFETWTRQHLSEGITIEEAAHAIATSKRTLARRLQAVLGRTPLAYVQDLRVERAVHLLRTTSLGLDAIAAQVGYADGITLRTLLRKRLGRTVRDVRRGPR